MTSLQYDKQVGQKIRELRHKHGLSGEQLAARLQLNGCNISQTTISKIELGNRHIYPAEIKALCSVFGITCDELLV